MPLPTNGKTKQYLAIIYMLVLTIYVIADKAFIAPKQEGEWVVKEVHLLDSRTTALEVDVRTIKESIHLLRAEIHLLRAETKQECRDISAKLDRIYIRVKNGDGT